VPPIALCNPTFTVVVLSVCLLALYQATTKAIRRVHTEGITSILIQPGPALQKVSQEAHIIMLHTDLNAEEITGELFEDEEISDVNEYKKCQYFTVLGNYDSFYEANERD
jgi:hypothetical protein